MPSGHKVRRKNYVEIFDKTAISNYCSSCLAGTCSGEYCAGVPGWIICRILLSDSRNLCCDRSFEHWVWNQYGLDNEINNYYDSSVCSTSTYRYGDSCSDWSCEMWITGLYFWMIVENIVMLYGGRNK